MEKQTTKQEIQNLREQIKSLIKLFESAIEKIDERRSDKNEIREKQEGFF